MKGTSEAHQCHDKAYGQLAAQLMLEKQKMKDAISPSFSPILTETMPKQGATKLKISGDDHFQIDEIGSPIIGKECKVLRESREVWENALRERSDSEKTPLKESSINKMSMLNKTAVPKKTKEVLPAIQKTPEIKTQRSKKQKQLSQVQDKENLHQSSVSTKQSISQKIEGVNKCSQFAFYTPQQKQVLEARNLDCNRTVQAFPVFAQVHRTAQQHHRVASQRIEQKLTKDDENDENDSEQGTPTISPYEPQPTDWRQQRFGVKQERTASTATLKDIMNHQSRSSIKVQNQPQLGNRERQSNLTIASPPCFSRRQAEACYSANHVTETNDGGQMTSRTGCRKENKSDIACRETAKKRKQSPLGLLLNSGKSDRNCFSVQQQQSHKIRTGPPQTSQFNSRTSLVPQTRISLQNTFKPGDMPFSRDGHSPMNDGVAQAQVTSVETQPKMDESELIKCQRALVRSQNENAKLREENSSLRHMLNYVLQAKMMMNF